MNSLWFDICSSFVSPQLLTPDKKKTQQTPKSFISLTHRVYLDEHMRKNVREEYKWLPGE